MAGGATEWHDTPGRAKGCCIGKDLHGLFPANHIHKLVEIESCPLLHIWKAICLYTQIELQAFPQQPKCTDSVHCLTHILKSPAPAAAFQKRLNPLKRVVLQAW